MDVYEAIRRMRKLSQDKKPFAVAFMSYSAERGKSHGIVEISRCVLTKQSTVEQNKHADIMLNYYDLDANKNGRMYQPLLLEFNGIQLELN
ncbi:hypothetical protein SDC9_128997 [bioreactor metagenome]|uniref:Uncharacterized protein n=1 Tax=bioreactor metagenome TaxID=1076179 RepID=A0A645CYD6_9ZZZZ|nr:hypothetical protein [Paludibacter sp.]